MKLKRSARAFACGVVAGVFVLPWATPSGASVLDSPGELLELLGPIPAYSGEAEMRSEHAASGTGSVFALRFVIAPGWSRLDHLSRSDQLGDSMMQASYGGYNDVVTLHPTYQQAQISDGYEQNHGQSIERHYSVAPLIRLLKDRSDLVTDITVIDDDSGTLRYRISWTWSAGEFEFDREYILEFDGLNLARLEETDGDGRTLTDIEYQRWGQLESGETVPVQTKVTLPMSAAEGDFIVTTYAISNLRAIDPSDRSFVLDIPPDYRLVDYIRGVVREANSTVETPMEQQVSQAQPATPVMKTATAIPRGGAGDRLMLALSALGLLSVGVGVGMIWRRARAA